MDDESRVQWEDRAALCAAVTAETVRLQERVKRWREMYAEVNRSYAAALNAVAEVRLTIKEQRSRIKELERLVERITGHAPAEYESIIRDMEGV